MFLAPSDPGAVELGMLRPHKRVRRVPYACINSGGTTCTCAFYRHGTAPLTRAITEMQSTKRPGWPGRFVGRGVDVTESQLPDAGRGAFVASTPVKNGDLITAYHGWKLSTHELGRYKPSQCTHASPA
jgi:hypothetical protein